MASEGQQLGRYLLFDVIATGGMASVHIGRMVGAAGFARTVAIKRLHPHLARDPEFVTMFLDEARLAARVHHPNVAPTLDVVALDGELLLVIEYIRGESLSRLLATARERGEAVPPPVLSAVAMGTLYGLHAAHEARDEGGKPLSIVHRDVSPQNVMVGVDGVARVVDFGVAKAASRAHSTRDGAVKGKLAYMSPEQIRRADVDRRADIYAVGVMLWEAFAARRLFVADDAAAVADAVLRDPVPELTRVAPGVSRALSATIHKALSRERSDRFASALEMAQALEAAVRPASQHEVGAWVRATAHSALASREALLAPVEGSTPSRAPPALPISSELRRFTEQPTEPAPSAKDGSSQLTNLTVARDVAPGSRGRWLLGAVALVAVSLLAVVASRSRILARPTPHAVALPAEAAPTASASTAASSTAASSATATAAPSATSIDSPTTLPRPSRATAPSPKRKRDCDPPFTVDSAGIERFKPWCL